MIRTPVSQGDAVHTRSNLWSRFWRLNRSERGLVLRALVLLPFLAAALRLLGFRRLQVALNRWTPERGCPRAGPVEVSQAQMVARMVAAAAREGPFRANCLGQSLALWWLLLRRRIGGELRIGVRKQAKKLEAHAWVELGGIVLNDHEGVRSEFAPFDRDISSLEVHSE